MFDLASIREIFLIFSVRFVTIREIQCFLIHFGMYCIIHLSISQKLCVFQPSSPLYCIHSLRFELLTSYNVQSPTFYRYTLGLLPFFKSQKTERLGPKKVASVFVYSMRCTQRFTQFFDGF